MLPSEESGKCASGEIFSSEGQNTQIKWWNGEHGKEQQQCGRYLIIRTKIVEVRLGTLGRWWLCEERWWLCEKIHLKCINV